jgi:hypothetical protein
LFIVPHTMRVDSDNAIASGEANWCRLIATNGRAVADFSVSTNDGPGWMVFNTIGFKKGGPVTVFARMALFSPQRGRGDDDVTAAIQRTGGRRQESS